MRRTAIAVLLSALLVSCSLGPEVTAGRLRVMNLTNRSLAIDIRRSTDPAPDSVQIVAPGHDRTYIPEEGVGHIVDIYLLENGDVGTAGGTVVMERGIVASSSVTLNPGEETGCLMVRYKDGSIICSR